MTEFEEIDSDKIPERNYRTRYLTLYKAILNLGVGKAIRFQGKPDTSGVRSWLKTHGYAQDFDVYQVREFKYVVRLNKGDG